MDQAVTTRNSKAWKEARRHLVGGVNSPVRAFKAVGGEPVFMDRGEGAYLYDVEGKRYIDYCLSWGAVLLGHADFRVVSAVRSQIEKGASFGTANALETELAEEIKKAFPAMENIRFTSSGTEAVMGAVRLARGVTGRSKVIKFVGCYHGHVDSLLIKAGSGAATFGVPDSAGVPADFAKHTLALPYNDTASVERVFKKLGRQIAAVVIEPVAGNMGVVPSDPGFLESLRHQTRRAGALLIFDEVMSGYRLGYGGAQHIYGIEPDLTTLGKVIGGGMPVGAFGGAAKWMRALSPVGPVYQAGTLSGHPVAMASGLAALKALSGDFYDKLTRRCEDFITRASGILARQGAVVGGKGTMFTVFFNAKRPRNFRDVLRSDQNKFRKFFHAMLDSGLYGPPSAFESSFISAAHGEKELSATLKVWERFRG